MPHGVRPSHSRRCHRDGLPPSRWYQLAGQAVGGVAERGDDLVTEIPADRWDVDEFYDPELGVPGKSVTRYGPRFLDDIWGFDAPFFGLRDAVRRPTWTRTTGC